MTYRAEDADTVLASISEELSKDYSIISETYELTHSGECTHIDASADVSGQFMPEILQAVYVIPHGEGCYVAWVHMAIEDSEGLEIGRAHV